jgi:hypothetical protein
MDRTTDRPRRGDLRVVSPPHTAADSRLCLVLRVHAGLGFAEVALVHPYAELATSADAVVPGVLVGTPYTVVVQTDLRGVVWLSQIGRPPVGRIGCGTLETISDLLRDGWRESSGVMIGTRLYGPHDRRWPFKESEGRALDLLTSGCAASHLQHLCGPSA